MKKAILTAIVSGTLGMAVWSLQGHYNRPNLSKLTVKANSFLVKQPSPALTMQETNELEKSVDKDSLIPPGAVSLPPATVTSTSSSMPSARSVGGKLSSGPQNHLSKSENPLSRALTNDDVPTRSATRKSPRQSRHRSQFLPASSASLLLELSPGVPAPLAFQPPEKELPSAQAIAQQQLARTFIDEIETTIEQTPTLSTSVEPAAPVSAPVTLTDTYYDALQISNEQYRALFGQEAANLAGIQAVLGSH